MNENLDKCYTVTLFFHFPTLYNNRIEIDKDRTQQMGDDVVYDVLPDMTVSKVCIES